MVAASPCISGIFNFVRIPVIIAARPTTTPERRGARKDMLLFMSEIISASMSLSLEVILFMFLTYSEMLIMLIAAILSPFCADSTRILMLIAISSDG